MSNPNTVKVYLGESLDVLFYKGNLARVNKELFVTFGEGKTLQLEGRELTIAHLAEIALKMGADINTKIKYIIG